MLPYLYTHAKHIIKARNAESVVLFGGGVLISISI